MKAILRIAVISLMLSADAKAETPDGSYVYLGAQTGGTSSAMVFVNNSTFARAGDQISAATVWVRNPDPGHGIDDSAPAYFLKDDIYYCAARMISHVRTRIYTMYGHLVSDGAEKPGLTPVKANTLDEFAFRKMCSSGSRVAGAQNDIITTVTSAFMVMAAVAPRTGKYAPPRSSQPLTIGYYPFGIAPMENIPAPVGGAYQIPPAGERAMIAHVYRAGDGHIIFGYYRKEADGGRSDYFDTALSRNLYPNQARAMAISRGGWLGEKLKPSGLRTLDRDFFALLGQWERMR